MLDIGTRKSRSGMSLVLYKDTLSIPITVWTRERPRRMADIQRKVDPMFRVLTIEEKGFRTSNTRI